MHQPLYLIIFVAGKSSSWQRFRYGRLSVDSDDQNFNNRGDEAGGSLLVNGDNMKYTYCDSIRKNQCVDKNGNNEVAENLNNNSFYTGSTEATPVGKESEDDENVVKPKKQIERKAISRLEAMAMSDDEDYGKDIFYVPI